VIRTFSFVFSLFLVSISTSVFSKTLLFSDGFESGFNNWVNVSNGDNNQWSRDASGTPSSGTGPSTGAASTFYVFLETSSKEAYTNGDTAILQGPVLSSSDIQLTFQYHMYGSDIGSLYVDVLEDGIWINDVWSLTGQQHATNIATYTNVDVDLSHYNVSQIRMRAVAAGGYRGDMAIDNIEIWSMSSEAVAPKFNSNPLFDIDVIQEQPYSKNIAGYASDGNGDTLIFSKVSGPAWLNISSEGDLSGIPEISDIGLNTFTVQVSDGELSSEAVFKINVDDGMGPTVIMFDDFETGFGNWSNTTLADSHDWNHHAGATPSSNTGPSNGEGGKGSYIYMETSSGFAYGVGDSTILNSPAITENKIHLSMSYHMYGANIGTLSVDVLSSGTWIYDVWSVTGQQHNTSDGTWSVADIDLSAYEVNQIRIRTYSAGGYMGDIGIDTLEIRSHVSGNDSDADGVQDSVDQCPNTPSNETSNANGCSPSQVDSDNDGVVDSEDAFPFDPLEALDTDGDLIGNNADTDDDGDGVLDIHDAFPLDASETIDTDGDLIGNTNDLDDDNDGVLDVNDGFPLINIAGYLDTDFDGRPNDCDNICTALGMLADLDDDGDSVPDTEDTFPLDPTESIDTDGDAIGNNADTDDDNDGISDLNDGFPLIHLAGLTDTDSDGIPNNCEQACLDLGMLADADDDGDGVSDSVELTNGTNTLIIDTDGDGWDDGAEYFCQTNGVDNTSYPTDSDADKVCDVMDLDDDSDGLIEIFTLADFNEIRNNINGSGLYGSSLGCVNCQGFELQNDLDFDENRDGIVDEQDHSGAYWDNGAGWLPIENRFDGTLEGNNFEIRNLTIVRPASSELGLFGSLAIDSSVRNLKLHGSIETNTGNYTIGLLAAVISSRASLNNIEVSGKINALGAGGVVGGIGGHIWGATSIENCSSSVDIVGGKYSGGLAGIVFGTSAQEPTLIHGITSSGNINGSGVAGGLIGLVRDVEIFQSSTMGNISTTATTTIAAVGGLIGRFRDSGKIHTSFSTGSVFSQGDRVGGLVGYSEDVDIKNAFVWGDVSGNGSVGGLVGESTNTYITWAYSAGIISGNLNVGSTIGLGGFGASYNSIYWNGDVNNFTHSSLGKALSEHQFICGTTIDALCSGESEDPFELFDSTYWDLGDATEFPALIFDGVVIRASDAIK